MAKENRFNLFAAFWVHKFDFGCFPCFPEGGGGAHGEPTSSMVPEIIIDWRQKAAELAVPSSGGMALIRAHEYGNRKTVKRI